MARWRPDAIYDRYSLYSRTGYRASRRFGLPHLLEVNAFLIFTAIIFWTWMWGAAGAMLALPLSIIGMTIADELRPAKRKARPNLPG